MNVIYCLIISAWKWLMSFTDMPWIPMQINPIKVHWGTGSWPFSFERSATFPPKADHVLVDLYSATMPQMLQASTHITALKFINFNSNDKYYTHCRLPKAFLWMITGREVGFCWFVIEDRFQSWQSQILLNPDYWSLQNDWPTGYLDAHLFSRWGKWNQNGKACMIMPLNLEKSFCPVQKL